jgi:cobalt-zinc-cadmium resistance protein CzcA
MVLGIFILSPAQSQKPKAINVQEAIQIALDNNLNIRSTAYSVEGQKILVGASWDIPKTTFEGQYGQFNSYNRDNSFSISQSLAFPTVYANQNKLSKAGIKSAELQQKEVMLDVSVQVKQVYWRLAYFYSRHRLLVYQDSLYSGFLRAAELRAKSGETNKLEMITARTQSLEIKNQLQQVQADIGIYNRKLQTLLNAGNPVRTSDTVLRRLDFNPVNNSKEVTNPSLEKIRQQVEVARITRSLENSRMMPDLSIGYFSQTNMGTQEIDGMQRTFGAGYRFTGIQAGIAIPLWFGPAVSKSKAAKIEQKVSQTNADYYAALLNSSFSSLLDEYNKYSASIEYYEHQAVPEANLIIEQSTLSYKAGALDYLDYVLSLNKALEIKQNYLDALNNFNQTLISMDSLTGKIF